MGKFVTAKEFVGKIWNRGQRSVKSLKDLESVEQIDYQNIHMERDWERAKSMIESALRKG